MNLSAEVRPTFEALMRTPLGESNPLRRQVSDFAADLHRRVEADELHLDLDLVDAVAECLENMLKRVSRKTTPLHHRLIHTTARFCTMGPADGRPLDDARLRVDVAVVNEAARVIRRPELTILPRR